jgi:hypothetical protein
VKKAAAPEKLTLADALPMQMPAFNSAIDINRIQPDIDSRQMPYTSTTDDGLASLRSKHRVRTFAEIEAAKICEPDLGFGLSLRQAMAGQAENNQFPFSTNQYGKQRS